MASTKTVETAEVTATKATLIAQLRTVLDLTHTEIQVAETRVAQARTDAVQRELTQNAENAKIRAEAIEKAIRDLGGFPDILGPFLGRAAAAVKALTEQAEPFDEALLGDLALEGQLLDRSRYVKALAVSAKESDVEELATRLITAHTATVEWLTTVLAEDALGGPAALRRTPLQAAAGLAVKLANLPFTWSTRGAERIAEALRSVRPNVDELIERGSRTGEVATKVLTGARDSALQTAERISRDQGAENAAEVIHAARGATGILTAEELPIADYDDLNVNDAASAVKELEEPSDIRAIIAYEEAHKDRQRVVSAAQTRIAAIAQEVVGINN
ncbi:ferritin-like domain-containing protein [Mycobacterium sp. 236(2023)]|uniref:ferritin-like domain-containing protein n=1 Tax=Mycobacterium sp. 236(2023) TaxID=3038163 RepID=UPI0024154EDD|nr:ferritin-like domain-containing protein [Mycobacterium sp. 236(2023)]MDG4667060.1 ferritin-like domain-containing protein [Mycobacterium sp. 236(2023)]